ncbi:hypothetical protein NXS19_014192 [Fusarium pseudograminearum]|nr:hypothetical protein NXS19_014192 [Fusarium pseudograminearum]
MIVISILVLKSYHEVSKFNASLSDGCLMGFACRHLISIGFEKIGNQISLAKHVHNYLDRALWAFKPYYYENGEIWNYVIFYWFPDIFSQNQAKKQHDQRYEGVPSSSVPSPATQFRHRQVMDPDGEWPTLQGIRMRYHQLQAPEEAMWRVVEYQAQQDLINSGKCCYDEKIDLELYDRTFISTLSAKHYTAR